MQYYLVIDAYHLATVRKYNPNMIEVLPWLKKFSNSTSCDLKPLSSHCAFSQFGRGPTLGSDA